MTLMPATDKAARDGWNALPEAVRRDALTAASRGLPADDPAVAAIIAGVLRERRPHQSWGRRVVGAMPFAAIVGGLVALQYFGLVDSDLVFRDVGFAWAVVVFALFAAIWVVNAVRDRRSKENLGVLAIPKYAELPNLRKALQTAAVTLAEPLTVYGIPYVRSFLLHTAAVGFLALAFITVLDVVRPEAGDYHRLLHGHFMYAGGAGVLAAALGWARHLLYLPIRMTDAGLRFGLRRTIPWRDVLGLEWAGPTAASPDTRPGFAWRLRDRRTIRIDLDSVLTPPEVIVQTMQAYLGRRDLLT